MAFKAKEVSAGSAAVRTHGISNLTKQQEKKVAKLGPLQRHLLAERIKGTRRMGPPAQGVC